MVIGTGDIARAENIVLRSGKKIQGKILEKTTDYIKVDYAAECRCIIIGRVLNQY